jgi:peroxiredoxin
MTQRAELVDAINAAIRQEDYRLAVDNLDKLAELEGETEKILEFKYDFLIKLGDFQAALEVIPKLERVCVRQSPWHCLKAAEAHLQLGHLDDGLTWIEKAVNKRAFRRVGVFDLPVYGPLQGNPRFIRCVEKARDNIGLGKPIPDFTVTLLTGESLTLSDLRGKVVLVDFWSTNCAPCVKEIPAIKNVYTQYHPQGFEIIGISLDVDLEKLTAFVRENDMQWPIVCSGKSLLDETVQLYKVNAQPSLWLVDREGILRYFDVRGESLEEAVRGLLLET